MAEHFPPEQVVSLQELSVSNAFEIAVLERRGLLTQQEVLEEIARQKKGRPHGT